MDPSTDANDDRIINHQVIDGEIELDSLSERSLNANPSSRKRRLQVISGRRKSSANYSADPYRSFHDNIANVAEASSSRQNLTADGDDEGEIDGGTEDDDHAETQDAADAGHSDDDDDGDDGQISESDVDEDDELRSDEDGDAEIDGAANDDDDDTNANGVENDGEEEGEAVESDDDDDDGNDNDAGEESDDAASANPNDDDDNNESTSYYSDSETESSRSDTTQSGDDDDDAEDSDDKSASQKKSDNADDENSLSDDQEEFEDYKVKKCYYPVQMEDFYAKRYSVIRKIGWGHFSTVWLCYDVQTKRFVALKVVRAGKTYCETAEDEIKLGLAVDEGMKRKGAVNPEAESLRNNLIRVLDNFNLSGPFGKHVCITFDLLGQNLLDLIKRAQEVREELGTARYGAIPLANVRSITEKILRGLKHLHENCQIIHTDLKPENVLLAVPERSIKEMVRYVSSLKKEQRPNYMMSSYEFRQYHKTGDAQTKDTVVDDRTHRHFLLDPDPSFTLVDNVQVKIADLGNACWTHKKFTDEIQTKEYRALESIVVADYGTSADIWSVACIAYECATGDYLFPCRHRRNRTSDEDHLLMIIERCARAIPKKLALAGKESKKFFHTNGKLICCPDLSQLLTPKSKTIRDLLTSRYFWTNEQAQLFSQFLLPMLEYDPDLRATADAMLHHSWMLPSKTHIHVDNHVLDAADAPSTSPARAAELTMPASNFFSSATSVNEQKSYSNAGAGFASPFQFQPLSASTKPPTLLSSPPTATSFGNNILSQKAEPSSFAGGGGKFSASMPYDGSGGGSGNNSFNLDDFRFSSAALSSNLSGGGNETGGASFMYGRFDAALGNSSKRISPQLMMMSAGGPAQQLPVHNDLMRDGGDFSSGETAAPLGGGKFSSSSANDAVLMGATGPPNMDEPVRKIDSLKLRSQS